jgi:hypothetical protein
MLFTTPLLSVVHKGPASSWASHTSLMKFTDVRSSNALFPYLGRLCLRNFVCHELRALFRKWGFSLPGMCTNVQWLRRLLMTFLDLIFSVFWYQLVSGWGCFRKSWKTCRTSMEWCCTVGWQKFCRLFPLNNSWAHSLARIWMCFDS